MTALQNASSKEENCKLFNTFFHPYVASTSVGQTVGKMWKKQGSEILF
ncbi:MAG: hypothetical protein JO210_17365 [Acidobacteriaceae bacterium]|nr:hypothetical protein [Acidobacteriaceae bacterium]